jgi:peptidoglycan LD-endopeptidase LytH
VTLENYSYLTSISPELILNSQADGKKISPTAWADLTAVRTSLPNEQQTLITQQLQSGIPLNKVSWKFFSSQVSEEMIKQIKLRRELLLTTHYFNPQYFIFPVRDKIWYDDTFGADREGGSRRHEGTDLFGPEGTSIFSVCAGKIEKLGWNRLGGERVGIRGEDGNYYYYAHLQSIEPSLKVGQKINIGDRLGTMGHTGDALTTPDHLHFGIELPNEVWINPYPFLYVWQHQDHQVSP